jgi:hypothetical protein
MTYPILISCKLPEIGDSLYYRDAKMLCTADVHWYYALQAIGETLFRRIWQMF